MYISNFDLFDTSLHLSAFYLISLYNLSMISLFLLPSQTIHLLFKDETRRVSGLEM